MTKHANILVYNNKLKLPDHTSSLLKAIPLPVTVLTKVSETSLLDNKKVSNCDFLEPAASKAATAAGATRAEAVQPTAATAAASTTKAATASKAASTAKEAAAAAEATAAITAARASRG